MRHLRPLIAVVSGSSPARQSDQPLLICVGEWDVQTANLKPPPSGPCADDLLLCHLNMSRYVHAYRAAGPGPAAVHAVNGTVKPLVDQYVLLEKKRFWGS